MKRNWTSDPCRGPLQDRVILVLMLAVFVFSGTSLHVVLSCCHEAHEEHACTDHHGHHHHIQVTIRQFTNAKTELSPDRLQTRVAVRDPGVLAVSVRPPYRGGVSVRRAGTHDVDLPPPFILNAALLL